uniref:DUF3265 domain-containing protein n=1 Tax=Ascaris lumbricoides TaxID=6252 RepID=A0A0M3HMQ3_ASCLU
MKKIAILMNIGLTNHLITTRSFSKAVGLGSILTCRANRNGWLARRPSFGVLSALINGHRINHTVSMRE